MGTWVAYVETNFLMGVATGRESLGDALASVASASIKIVIPSSCYMEAFSALEDERTRRNWFRNRLEEQIRQLRRDTSLHAKSLLSHLEESRLVNDRLLNDIQDRLFQFIGRASPIFESIHPTPLILQESVNNVMIEDPTDNFILCCILDHARNNPADERALLTSNYTDFNTPEVRSFLQKAGITKYFRDADNCLGWLRSLPG